MPVSKRHLIEAGTAGIIASFLLAPKTVTADTTDLAVTCDMAAAPAVISAGMAFRQRAGIRVRVFPTSPGLILPQLEREIQNDIIFTQVGLIERAEQQNLVKPGGRAGPWRNRLVSAVAKQPAGPEGSFAAPDPSPASDIDGIAIAQRLGFSSSKVMGVLDTRTVAWLLTRGGARRGLLHQTEVWANDALHTVLTVPDEVWPPIVYAATVTTLAYRGDPRAFVAFLGSAEGLAVLSSAGLEQVS